VSTLPKSHPKDLSDLISLKERQLQFFLQKSFLGENFQFSSQKNLVVEIISCENLERLDWKRRIVRFFSIFSRKEALSGFLKKCWTFGEDLRSLVSSQIFSLSMIFLLETQIFI